MLKEIAKRTVVRLRHIHKNIHFGMGTDVSVSAEFEGNNRIGKNCYFAGKMGIHSYIGDNCIINAFFLFEKVLLHGCIDFIHNAGG